MTNRSRLGLPTTILLAFWAASTALGQGNTPTVAQPKPRAAKPAGMTVEDVIKLTKAGLSDDLIIVQIKKTGKPFDLSTDQLIQLKSASVSDRVIQCMLDPTREEAPPAAPPPTPPVAAPSVATVQAPPTPNTSYPTELGVYVKKAEEWVELTPEIVNWKTGGGLKTIATAGVVRGDLNGHLPGATSRNALPLPIEFLLVVPEGTSATEYQLLHLRISKDSREFRTVTGGALHSESGSSRDLIPFDPEKVSDRAYTVRFPASLGAGEYGFLPPGSNGMAGKIYPFHVSVE